MRHFALMLTVGCVCGLLMMGCPVAKPGPATSISLTSPQGTAPCREHTDRGGSLCRQDRRPSRPSGVSWPGSAPLRLPRLPTGPQPGLDFPGVEQDEGRHALDDRDDAGDDAGVVAAVDLDFAFLAVEVSGVLGL
jgi:hypothetical protein